MQAKKWARIMDGKPVEILTEDPAGRFHADILWVPVPEELAPYIDSTYTWDKDAGAFVEEQEGYTLEKAITAKQREIMDGYKAVFADVEQMYPQCEREGWALQEAEATALMADPEAAAPVLSALVQIRARGETPAELAEKVLENAVAWRGFYAWYTGQQQKMYAEVARLKTVAEVTAYRVFYARPTDSAGE